MAVLLYKQFSWSSSKILKIMKLYFIQRILVENNPSTLVQTGTITRVRIIGFKLNQVFPFSPLISLHTKYFRNYVIYHIPFIPLFFCFCFLINMKLKMIYDWTTHNLQKKQEIYIFPFLPPGISKQKIFVKTIHYIKADPQKKKKQERNKLTGPKAWNNNSFS